MWLYAAIGVVCMVQVSGKSSLLFLNTILFTGGILAADTVVECSQQLVNDYGTLPADMKKTCCLVTFKRLENPPIPGYV